jgi:hypothetical protein
MGGPLARVKGQGLFPFPFSLFPWQPALAARLMIVMLPFAHRVDVQGGMMIVLEELRYPVGHFTPVATSTPAARAAAIEEIAALPARMRAAVDGLAERQLDTPYRPGGWTVRQVVHHVADSHMHGLIRIKLALIEDTPTIKPYDENACAALADTRLPVDVSLSLLDGIHARWIALYRSMTDEQFARSFFHPERGETFTLHVHAQDYAWHSRHHVAHITSLRRREGW